MSRKFIFEPTVVLSLRKYLGHKYSIVLFFGPVPLSQKSDPMLKMSTTVSVLVFVPIHKLSIPKIIKLLVSVSQLIALW